MKSLRILMLALAAAMLTATIASAHPVTPRVDRREARQGARIHQGVRHGQLTRAEARALRAGQLRVRRMERRAKRDGRVTLRERARLQRMLDRQHRRIFRFRHDSRSI